MNARRYHAALFGIVSGCIVCSGCGESNATLAQAAAKSNACAPFAVHPGTVDPTPYPYDCVPPRGAEEGTYIAQFSGSLAGCYFTSIGTARLLPNADGSGGTHCFVTTLDMDTTNPLCIAVANLGGEGIAVRFRGTYTYTGDGDLCEVFQIIGGLLDGATFPALTQVLPDGNLVVSTLDVRSFCPEPPASRPGTPTLLGTGIGHRIGEKGDDPRGSGKLDCG